MGSIPARRLESNKEPNSMLESNKKEENGTPQRSEGVSAESQGQILVRRPPPP
jgi:hypothetical protein